MNYPLRVQYLTRDYAAVRCRLVYRPPRYIVEPDEKNPVFLISAGSAVTEIPAETKVVTENGEEVFPTGRFFRTVETINPYHAVLDIWDFNVLR